MGRMDKYEGESNISYSRTKKNEDLYKDVYLNNTLIDFSKIITEEDEIIEEEQDNVVEFKTINYTEKEYNLNKYLEEKRALHQKDNRPRSLNEEIKKSDNEINELVSKIEQREKEEDLFNDLMPDDDNTTTIGANNELNSFVSDTVIDNYVMNKDMDETNSFMDLDETKIIEEKKEKKKQIKNKIKKNNDLPIIVFCSIALMLVGVIIYIVIKVF